MPGSIPEIRSSEAVQSVLELMAIPGKSGEEAEVVAYLRRRLREAGVPASSILADCVNRRSPAGGDTGNLIVKFPGSRRGPRRLLMAHIDTVPLCVGCKPVQEGAFIRPRSRGTALGADDRAGASLLLQTVCEILRTGLPHPPLTFLWSVQEEIGLYGVRYASLGKLGKPRLCFNWDGGAPNTVVVGATGGYAMDIVIDGVASHAGAHPDDGVSAVAIAGLAIAELVQNGWHGLIVKEENTGTSNIGVIVGGSATNVVAPTVRLQAEARSHSARFRRRIVAEFRRAFVNAAKRVTNTQKQAGQVTFNAALKYESFRLPLTEPCVQAAMDAVRSIGLEPGAAICNGGLDANWMMAHGLPTVTLGCGQQGAHTVDEALHIDSYLQACRVALAIAMGV